MLSAIVNPVKYASYSAALLEHEKPSLKDKGMISPFSQLSTIPTPFEVAVADSSNLMVHFFPGISVTATSQGFLRSAGLLPFLGIELANLLWPSF